MLAEQCKETVLNTFLFVENFNGTKPAEQKPDRKEAAEAGARPVQTGPPAVYRQCRKAAYVVLHGTETAPCVYWDQASYFRAVEPHGVWLRDCVSRSFPTTTELDSYLDAVGLREPCAGRKRPEPPPRRGSSPSGSR